MIVLLLFLAVSALIPGGLYILAPDGHLLQMPLSNLENAPFSDFLVPGIILFIFIGVYPTLVAYSLLRLPDWRWPDALNPFKQYHWSWAGSLAAGTALIVWIMVQIQWVKLGFLHITYLVYGILLVVITLLPGVRKYCDLK